MKASLFVVLAFNANIALAGISSSPGLQRKVQGQNCTFQWTVTGTVTDFVIYNQTTGTSAALNSQGSQNYDSTSKTVSLTIISIKLWDAGNYSLSVYNGAVWENDSSALLFVFVSGSTSWSQTLGQNPATEGDSVELTCAFTSASVPVAYRPRVLYTWYPQRFPNYLQVLSNGSLQILNGDIVSRYSTRNNGRTLAIASVEREDAQFISCKGMEEGSVYTYSWSSSNFSVKYKPVVLLTNPPSRKFNAIVGDRVRLSVDTISVSPSLLATGSNWTFDSSQDLPDNSVVGSYTSPSLSFNLTSISYYGKYSYDLTNAIGTTTVTFEVLPPGPPDAPAAFQVAYVTHFSIALQWNCMWSNFNRSYQYVYTQLRDPKSNVTVGAYNTSVSGFCYNSTTTVTYSSAIQPDTQYEASVWSTNSIGSSSVTQLNVQSAKVFRFVVSSDSIKINGTTAVINYRLESGNITRFYVTCCYEFTGSCTSVVFNVNNTYSQVSLYIGNLPNGTDYIFDFTLYVGNTYTILGMVRGIRASTAIMSAGNFYGTSGSNDLAPVAIALAVLLAVAVFAIAGMLLGFFIWKRRNHFPTSKPQQPNSSGMSRSVTGDEDQYEEMDRRTGENRVYTNLDLSKRS